MVAVMMNEGAYSALYKDYDKLNSETDYTSWADFICSAFEKYKPGLKTVADLGCGTGAMTFELWRRGYNMTAIDISIDMLSVAKNEAAERGADDILWLCQDMRSFELYGTVEAAVCCLDGINHLTGAGDIAKCFSLVHNYLEPGGVFVFDVNTPYKFEHFYGSNDYILEDSGVVCCWQNSYDRRRHICDFYLSVFEKTDSGLWSRTDTTQRERCYTMRQLTGALERAGFDVKGVFGDFMFSAPEADCQRWYIVATAVK